MLQVIRSTGEQAVFCTYPRGGTNVRADDGTLIAFIGCAGVIFPMYGSTLSSLDIQGSIVTSPSHYLDGENDCHHENIHGSIFPLTGLSSPSNRWLKWTQTLYQWNYPAVKSMRPVLECRHGAVDNLTWVSSLLPYNVDTELNFSGRLGYKYSSWNPIVFYGNLTYLCMLRTIAGRTYLIESMCRVDDNGWTQTKVDWIIIEFSPSQGFRTKCNGTYEYKQKVENYEDLKKILDTFTTPAYYPTGAWSWTVAYPHFRLVNSLPKAEPDYTSLLSSVLEKVDDFLPVNVHDVNWGELSYNSIRQMKLWDSNGLALSREIIGLRKEVTSILKLIADIENPKKWASMFLSYKYGVRLTVADTKSLLEAMMKPRVQHIGPAKVSSSTNYVINRCACEAHYAIYYERSPQVLDQLYAALDRYDMVLNLKNAWDLLPYTFIVDWFVDVGGILDQIDALATLQSHKVIGTMSSLKATRSITPDQIGFNGWGGNIEVVKYIRSTSDICEPPSFVLDIPITEGFDHFLEAGALILQKIFH